MSFTAVPRWAEINHIFTPISITRTPGVTKLFAKIVLCMITQCDEYSKLECNYGTTYLTLVL